MSPILTSQDGSSYAFRRNQNTVRFSVPRTLGPISRTVIIVLMFAVLAMIYLTQVTKTGVFGYQINDLSAKKEQLLSQSQDLEVENARLQALQRVEQSNVAQAMTSSESTSYAN